MVASSHRPEGSNFHAKKGYDALKNMPKRVLILSASVGAGHLRAAQAVELALRALDPSCQVRNIDVLTLATRAFRALYGQGYLDLVNKAPHALGYFYELLDAPPKNRNPKRDLLRLAVEKLNLRPFLRLLKDEPWDIAVNCHFLPAEIIASLRKTGELDLPQMTVTTDFETHRLWVNQPCERYFTATEEGAAYLAYWGIPPETITVSGIPVHPAFSRPKDRETCLRNQGLRGDRPMVLQLAGGFGVGPVKEIFQGLLAVKPPLEIVVAAGRNEALAKDIRQIRTPQRHRVKVMGFTDQMDEFMACADLVLSKPGGLTTSEALARSVPMAIVNPIPGQESRNSDFLLEGGAAVKISHPSLVPLKLGKLLGNPRLLTSLKAGARRLGRPQAAFTVAQAVLEYLKQGT